MRVQHVLLAVAATVGVGTLQTGSQVPDLALQSRYVYVFAHSGDYAAIDPQAARVVSTGRINEVSSIDRVYANGSGTVLFLQASDPSTATAESVKQLAIVTEISSAGKPALQFTRWLRGPTPASQVRQAKPLKTNALLASWQNQQASTVIYDAAFVPQRTIENFVITPMTCIDAEGRTIYSVANNSTREIKILDLKSGEVKNSSYASLGSVASYKAPVAIDGCNVAIIERPPKLGEGASTAKVYLFDVEKGLTVNRFDVAGDGRFAISLGHKLLVLDLTTLAPNTIGGKTIGLRRTTTGTLIFYDITTGREAARISVPQDGELSGISSDGRTGYYLSHNLLTMIDLEHKRVGASVELHFPHGMLAIGR